ncbi:MAG: 4-hydroxy-3-methylbut-2-enyl diphosphate reductase [Oxalobacter sp.]|nr:4-hydroxy-3-methylbut-2-enyl diphosphate reductase [Oxalobacter sp.]
MKLILAQPRGFCAGVKRAIETVERALALFGPPIYVRHEIVHNTYVVGHLREKGAVFIEDLDEVPSGSILIFSAHGVSRAIRQDAEQRNLTLFDATCPLVTKVHAEVHRRRREGHDVIVIGHKGHPEVEGTMGQSETGMHLISHIDDIDQVSVPNPEKIAYVSQTTLSVDDTATIINALKHRWPKITPPQKSDICYATTNRQEAIRQLARQASLILVVGSSNSSNSNRLREMAERNGAEAYMVDNASQIQRTWLKGHENIGITAGASAPEILVQEIVALLVSYGYKDVHEQEGMPETISFGLPKGLRDMGQPEKQKSH